MTTSPENDLTGPSLGYDDALTQAKSGFLIAREKWADQGAFAAWAVSGSFIAFDKTSGRLEPFLVVGMNGLFVPYQASDEDKRATDWLVLTRQQVDRS